MTSRLARQKRLFEQLANKLAKNGFNPKPDLKNNVIHRAFPGGRHLLHLATPSWGATFEAVPDVAVRIDAIEDLCNQGLSRSAAAQTATVGADFNRLGGRRAWPVESDADVAVAARGILADFSRIGEPYLTRFSSVAEILRVCSRDGEAAELAMDDPGLREDRAGRRLHDREQDQIRSAAAQEDRLAENLRRRRGDSAPSRPGQAPHQAPGFSIIQR